MISRILQRHRVSSTGVPEVGDVVDGAEDEEVGAENEEDYNDREICHVQLAQGNSFVCEALVCDNHSQDPTAIFRRLAVTCGRVEIDFCEYWIKDEEASWN